MASRLTFLQELQAQYDTRLVSGFNRWRNIEGVLEFFVDHQVGVSGTWISYVDAGILEAIERGTAIALGMSVDDFGNPGSRMWASYLDRLKRGELTDRIVHDRAWGNAEQVSTEYAVQFAEAHNILPTGVECRFYLFSQSYRWYLRNELPALRLLEVYGPDIDSTLVELRTPFLSWLTDVTNNVPTRKGSEIAYYLASRNPVYATVSIVGLVLSYLPELFREFRQTTAAGRAGLRRCPSSVVDQLHCNG